MLLWAREGFQYLLENGKGCSFFDLWGLYAVFQSCSSAVFGCVNMVQFLLSLNFTKDLLVLLSFLIKLTWKEIWEKWLHELCREKQRELWFYFLFVSFYFCECLWKNLRYSSGLRKHFAPLNESSCLESMRALSLIPAGALLNLLQICQHNLAMLK